MLLGLLDVDRQARHRAAGVGGVAARARWCTQFLWDAAITVLNSQPKIARNEVSDTESEHAIVDRRPVAGDAVDVNLCRPGSTLVDQIPKVTATLQIDGPVDACYLGGRAFDPDGPMSVAGRGYLKVPQFGLVCTDWS